jgi:hypothetical protein
VREREGSGALGRVAGSGTGPRWGWLDRFLLFFFFQNLLNHTFKPFLNQNFTRLFTNYFTIIFKNFHKYFKTFKTTPQPKLMHSNHDAQALIASKLLK